MSSGFCALGMLLGVFAMTSPLVAQQSSAYPTSSEPRTIDLNSSDGITLKASYFSAGRPGPGLLLFHACNRDRSSWNGLATAAAARGIHVLAMDFRGYGQSGGTRGDDPQQVEWIAGREWPGDIDAAYAWLISQAGVDKTRMAAAGASCGANQAVQLARRHPEVRTVVLLSGAIAPEGREFIRDSAWLPIFGAASQGDGGAVETLRWAMGWSRNPSNRFVECQAAGHGTDRRKGASAAGAGVARDIPQRRAADAASRHDSGRSDGRRGDLDSAASAGRCGARAETL